MEPRLSADESLLEVTRYQIGAGLLDRWDAQRIHAAWQNQSAGGQSGAKRKAPAIPLTPDVAKQEFRIKYVPIGTPPSAPRAES